MLDIYTKNETCYAVVVPSVNKKFKIIHLENKVYKCKLEKYSTGAVRLLNTYSSKDYITDEVKDIKLTSTDVIFNENVKQYDGRKSFSIFATYDEALQWSINQKIKTFKKTSEDVKKIQNSLKTQKNEIYKLSKKYPEYFL